jgi:hypothetical protein
VNTERYQVDWTVRISQSVYLPNSVRVDAVSHTDAIGLAGVPADAPNVRSCIVTDRESDGEMTPWRDHRPEPLPDDEP